MKKIIVLLLVFLFSVSTASALVEPGFTKNTCRHPSDGYIDFEDGTEGQVIWDTIPGVEFTNTGGLDWVYADFRSGNYNMDYQSDGNFVGWLGPSGSEGKISFTHGSATYISALVKTYSGVMIDAYDKDGNFLATSGSASDNLGSSATRLTVEAPPGTQIAYVVVHDTGNYWNIDDICTDAAGITPAPEFPSLVLPLTLIIGFMGTVLILKGSRKP